HQHRGAKGPGSGGRRYQLGEAKAEDSNEKEETMTIRRGVAQRITLHEGHSCPPLRTHHPSGRKRLVTGYVLTALVALFLTFDTVIKVLKLAPAVQGTTQLGYPANSVFWIGLIELVSLALYLVPRTSVLGALLLTGYLGGAIATHVRISSPLLSHTLFPIYV